MNDILQETPLKLGCCSVPQNKQNDSVNVTVRSPIDPTSKTIDNNYKKFGFQQRVLTIPPNTCPTFMYAGSDYCNMFMQATCENVYTVFSENPNVTLTDFINYAPECACYAPSSGALANVNSSYNIPPMCYKDGCNVGSKSYIDPVSRAQGTCNSTICANIFNAIQSTGGQGTTNNNPVLQNNCGPIPSSTNNLQNSPTSMTNSTNNLQNSPTSMTKSTIDAQNNSSNYIFYIIIIVVFIILVLIVLFLIPK
jgi:hypothetical protein